MRSREHFQKGPKRLVFDSPNLKSAKSAMEISNVLGGEDGTGTMDWEAFAEYLDFVYAKKLITNADFHPVLMTEQPNGPKADRERLTELMFEKFKVNLCFFDSSLVPFLV